MDIQVIRKTKTDKSAIGEMSIDGQFFCYTLEDTDRGLKQTDSLDQINKNKIFGVTAIPTGTYNVTITKSLRFSQMAGKDIFLPLINNVPGYEGVRIHGGNKPEDTEGCLLVGLHFDPDMKNFIGMSQVALQKLMAKLKDQEHIILTIK